MTISLIASVYPYKNKLAIGIDNDLLVKLQGDLLNFKNVTQTIPFMDTSSLDKNVVLMGRKTWFSLPQSRRPLPGRINIVLTNDKALRKSSPLPQSRLFMKKAKVKEDVYFLNFNEFLQFYKETDANVFVIGGGEIYNQFLNNKFLKPQKIYLTHIISTSLTGLLNESESRESSSQIVYMQNLDDSFILESYSDTHIERGIKYRFLKYTRIDGQQSDEHNYLALCKDVMDTGMSRDDRTGVGTFSKFGCQIRFDISNSIPLLTTKRVPWKHCLEELLWFLRGDTDAKILQKKGVHIWDANTSREFLDKKGLHHYETGILGPGYSWNWRFFGAKYTQAFADTSKVDTAKIGGVDQIAKVIDLLKNDPFSRRILVSAWNPSQLDEVALPPCHLLFQFYVEEDKNGQRHLSCHFIHRSQDLLLGSPFNIFSYACLTYILALKTDMIPKHLVMTVSDAHIYKNHIQQMNSQLERSPHPFPKLFIDPLVKNKDFKDITINDFDVIGYFPDAHIKAPMAV